MATPLMMSGESAKNLGKLLCTTWLGDSSLSRWTGNSFNDERGTREEFVKNYIEIE
jgi:hypothetical protein